MSQWAHRLRELTTLDAGRRIFGARSGVSGWGHGYDARQVTEADLGAFEAWCGCQLPSSYRQYLLDVGLGPGPYYGLMPFEKVREELTLIYEDYAEDVGTEGKPGNEFVLEAELTVLRARNPEETCDFSGPRSPGGFIPICYRGCEFVIVMVTSGSHAGSVFTTTDFATIGSMWAPAGRPPGIVAYQRPRRVLPGFPAWPNFAEWVDGWLEQCFADLRGDPAAT